MNCELCQHEMVSLSITYYDSVSAEVFWCQRCGSYQRVRSDGTRGPNVPPVVALIVNSLSLKEQPNASDNPSERT